MIDSCSPDEASREQIEVLEPRDHDMRHQVQEWLESTAADIRHFEECRARDDRHLSQLRPRHELLQRLLGEGFSEVSFLANPASADHFVQPNHGSPPDDDKTLLDEEIETDLKGARVYPRRGEAAVLAAAEAVLSRVESMHYRDLAAFVGRHVHLGGRDRANTLIAYLHKGRERFARIGRGIYAMRKGSETTPAERDAELSPQRRRKKRKRKVARALGVLSGRG